MDIQNKIEPIQNQLFDHKIYSEIKTIDELRVFMQAHVFAVWDFMSLVKKLQMSLTCVSLPWFPPSQSKSARLINEIVLYEETDFNYQRQPSSHLEMYLDSMKEIGADTSMFDSFLNILAKTNDLKVAFTSAKVPTFISNFVGNNIKIVLYGNIEEVASNFLFGREDSIPEMFTRLLDRWKIDEEKVPSLIYYLKRHIDLDSNEHGPAGHKLLSDLIGKDEVANSRALNAATNAILDRISLWDGILEQINQYRNQSQAVTKEIEKVV